MIKYQLDLLFGTRLKDTHIRDHHTGKSISSFDIFEYTITPYESPQSRVTSLPSSKPLSSFSPKTERQKDENKWTSSLPELDVNCLLTGHCGESFSNIAGKKVTLQLEEIVASLYMLYCIFIFLHELLAWLSYCILYQQCPSYFP